MRIIFIISLSFNKQSMEPDKEYEYADDGDEYASEGEDDEDEEGFETYNNNGTQTTYLDSSYDIPDEDDDEDEDDDNCI
jgi:hypothetical protein